MPSMGLCDRCGAHRPIYKYRIVQVENPDAWEHVGGANIDVCSKGCLDAIMQANIQKFGKLYIQPYEDA